MQSNSQRAFWAAFAATICFFAAFYALIIPLPLYMQAEGISDWHIGVVMGAFGIASLIGRPFAGAMSDRYGVRPVIVYGTIALACGGSLVGVTNSVPLLFVLRLLQASGYVAFTTAATAMVSGMFASTHRGTALARYGTAANIAITVVPLIMSAVLPTIGTRGAFVASGIAACIAGLVIWQIIPAQTTRTAPTALPNLFAYPRIIWPAMLTTFCFGVGFGAYFQYLPLLAERRDITPVGLVYVAYGVAIIATRLLSGRFIDGADRRLVLIPAALLTAVGMLLFAVADNLWVLMLAAACTASGGGLSHPALIAIHVDRVPERGRATAAFYLAFDLGIGIGSWVLAAVLQSSGMTMLYAVAAIISVCAVLLSRRISPAPTA
ncbi:MAG: hypothetical protein RLY87_1723 [Chloroflexota bacterium]|jgi:MFS family permease